MKTKTALRRSIVVVSIVTLSVLIGFLCQSLLHRMDLKNYPRTYSEYVSQYAEEYGVPEYVAYGVIKYESSFASNHVGDDGGIGLMGIDKDSFDGMMRELGENLTHDALYGPETNIKYGIYELSRLFVRYGKWSYVMAAKAAGAAQSDRWLSDTANFDDTGSFTGLPKDSANVGDELIGIAEKYRVLYYDDLSGK